MISVPMDGFGGGAPLNFAVRTYATKEELLAATPKENTIGLITSIPMAGYIFAVNQPDTSEVGVVWINVGTASTVAFNATKRNPIRVYPLSAKILNDSLVWESVEALTYINGRWTEWATYLYNNGDECTDLTGGWGSSDFGYEWAGESDNINPAVKNDDSITVQSISGKASIVGTWNKIDVTNYSTINVELTSDSTVDRSVVGLFWDRECNPNSDSCVSKVVYPSGTRIVVTLDISSVSGSYYVVITTDSQNTTIVHEVRLVE